MNALFTRFLLSGWIWFLFQMSGIYGQDTLLHQSLNPAGGSVYMIAAAHGILYCGYGGSFTIMSYREPGPVPLSRLVLDGDVSCGLKDSNLVICGTSRNTVYLIDVSDTLLPEQTGSVAFPSGEYFTGIAKSGNTLVAGTSVSGYHIFNISQPDNPQFLTTLAVNASGLAITDTLLYLISWDSLRIFSISDPANPIQKGAVKSEGESVNIYNQRLYMLGKYQAGLKVYDLTDPVNPVLFATFMSPYTCKDLSFDNGKAFIAFNYSYNKDSILICNLDDPVNPVRLGAVRYYGFRKVIGKSDRMLVQVFQDNSLWISDISNLPQISVVFFLRNPLTARTFALRDDDLYIGSSDNVWHYQLNSQGEFSLRNVMNVWTAGWGRPNTMMIHDNILFLATTNSKIYLIDISDPDTMQTMGFYPVTGSEQVRMATDGTWLFLLIHNPSSGRKLETVSISNPASPSLAHLRVINGWDMELDPPSARLYISFYNQNISGHSKGVLMINVSNPQQPQDMIVLPSMESYQGIDVDSGKLYIVSNDNAPESATTSWLEIYDVSDTASAGMLAAIPMTAGCWDILADSADFMVSEISEGLNFYAYTGAAKGVLDSYHKTGSIPAPGIRNIQKSKPTGFSGNEVVVYHQSTQTNLPWYSYASYDGAKGERISITDKNKCHLFTKVLPAEAAAEGCNTDPAGITTYIPPYTQTISANSIAGWQFREWKGDLSGSANPASILLDDSKMVTAVFEKASPAGPELSITGSGSKHNLCPVDTTLDLCHTSICANEADDWELSQIVLDAEGSGDDLQDIDSVFAYVGNTLVYQGKYPADNGSVAITFSPALIITAGSCIQMRAEHSFSLDCEQEPPDTIKEFELRFTDPVAQPRNLSSGLITGNPTPDRPRFAKIWHHGNPYNRLHDVFTFLSQQVSDDTAFICNCTVNEDTVSEISIGVVPPLNDTTPVTWSSLIIRAADTSEKPVIKLNGNHIRLYNLAMIDIRGIQFDWASVYSDLYKMLEFENILVKTVFSDCEFNGRVKIDYCPDFSCSHCTFNNHTQWNFHNGLEITSIGNCRISQTTFQKTGLDLYNVDHGVITFNHFNGSQQRGTGFSFRHGGDAYIFDSDWSQSSLLLFDNQFSGYHKGIEGFKKSNVKLNFNTLNNCDYGIYLDGCRDGELTGNIIREGKKSGIELHSCDRSSVRQNTVSNYQNGNTQAYGLKMIFTTLTNVTGNRFHHNCTNISIISCPFSEIDLNDIIAADCGNTGIRLINSPVHITGNNIINNQGNGLFIDTDCLSGSIRLNNFSGNGAYHVESLTGTTTDARNNWWGHAGGPAVNMIADNIVYEPFLTSMQAMTVRLPDTLFLAINTADTLTVFLNNLSIPGDSIAIQVSESKPWITAVIPPSVMELDSAAASVDIPVFIPAGNSPGVIDTVIINMTSITDAGISLTDTMIIISYIPYPDTILLAPDSVILAAGEHFHLNVNLFDQHQHATSIPLVIQATGGLMDSLNNYTAGTIPGEYTITVSDSVNTVSATAWVLITDSVPYCVSLGPLPDTVFVFAGESAYIKTLPVNQFGLPVNTQVKWRILPDTTIVWVGSVFYFEPDTGQEFASVRVTDEQNLVSDTIVIHTIHPLISGICRYDNLPGTPLTEVQLVLQYASQVVAQTVSDSNGQFSLEVPHAGHFTLTATGSAAWGGVNAIDALVIMNHFVGIDTLTGLKFEAADLNGDHVRNSIDAMLAMRRFVGLLNGFSVSDWIFETFPLMITTEGLYMNIKGLCSGDVNGSYNP